MPELSNPEQVHIGQALDRHRGNLGVPREQLTATAGMGSSLELDWTVAARQPSILRIRRYHYLLLEAYESLDVPPAASVPFRQQWFTTDRDRALHQQVLSGGRRTAWWWGAKRTERGSGAYCYVCSTLVHAYDLSHGVTHPVRLAVMEHRAEHVAAALGISDTMRQRPRS